MPLSSVQNPKVKLARALTRRKGREEHGLFLVEGGKLLTEALAWGWRPVMTFAAATWWTAAVGDPVFGAIAGERFEVSEQVLAALATTDGHIPVVAVFPLPPAPSAVLAPGALAVIAHRLQDPGNLGTIIRAADAAGAVAVVVTPETVDPFGPKAVRASMGSIFHLAVPRLSLAAWKAANPDSPLYAMTLDRADSLYDQDLRPGGAFLIGNEGAGLLAADEAVATCRLRIPIPGHAESLNAAMAATICLFEAARQRFDLVK